MRIKRQLRIGSRKSELAIKQAEIVRDFIEMKFPDIKCHIEAVKTLGDQVQTKPLYSFDGKALWTRELEALLLRPSGDTEQLDMVIHCLKDMPTHLPPEFELGCIFNREDPTDAFVAKKGSKYKTLDELPEGSLVGTSSLRRKALLLKRFPHLKVESIRGNVHTRLRKLDDANSNYEGVILASAGLQRIGLDYRITHKLGEHEMMYAVGQGALGIEIRKNDYEVRQILQLLEEVPITYCGLAERALMRTLEGGCSVPIGVWTDYDSIERKLSFKAIIASEDGKESIEDEVLVRVEDVDGAEAAGVALAEILIRKGARQFLHRDERENGEERR